MISIEGTLAIRKISGRNGDFSVGELQTSIGVFAVKDTVLDQYEEGKYRGTFMVNHIAPHSYTPYGSCYTVNQIRAFLEDFTLDDIDQGNVESVELIQDPLDEEKEEHKPEPAPAEAEQAVKQKQVDLLFGDPKPQKVKADSQPAKKSADTSPASSEAKTESPEDEAGKELFGSAWPIGSEVKLDATLSRELFRKQKEYLGKHGYEFKPMEQKWIKQ